MKRAIDSEKFYDFLTGQLVKETGAFSKGVNKGLNIARSALHNEQITPTLTPPNDPVHAAGACYCWECKYFDPDENIAPNTGSCSFVEMVRFFDDFCSKGERKEETP